MCSTLAAGRLYAYRARPICGRRLRPPGRPPRLWACVGAVSKDGCMTEPSGPSGPSGPLAALERFSAPTREWFRAAFAAPTPAQAGAWEAIADGRHALVVAPTGSGKTLSAFLWAIDGLLTRPPSSRKGTRVLYVSPLKALAV